MARFGKQEFWQGASCLLCLAVAWIRLDDIGASEFIGGRVTGPQLTMAECGSCLFMPALIMTFFYRRIAAGIVLMVSSICLPLNSYFMSPSHVRVICRFDYT